MIDIQNLQSPKIAQPQQQRALTHRAAKSIQTSTGSVTIRQNYSKSKKKTHTHTKKRHLSVELEEKSGVDRKRGRRSLGVVLVRKWCSTPKISPLPASSTLSLGCASGARMVLNLKGSVTS